MNRSAFGEHEYDDSIKKTLPFYAQMQEQVIDLVNRAGLVDIHWLDTGCVTGNLAELAVRKCRVKEMTLADPSSEMLKYAGQRAAAWHVPVHKICAGTEELSYSLIWGIRFSVSFTFCKSFS